MVLRPATATSPLSSCSVAIMRQRAMSASGAGPPNMPLCTAPSKGLDLDVERGHAAERCREGGHAEGVVADVADDDDVGLEQLGVGVHELLDAALAGLFLALDEHLDAHRAVVAEGQQRPGVHDDAALVVGGATAVQAAVTLGGLERLGVPQLFGPGRLDVVVRVEQDRGRAVAGRALAEHRLRRARHVHHAHAGQAGLRRAARPRPRPSAPPARPDSRGRTPPRGGGPAS